MARVEKDEDVQTQLAQMHGEMMRTVRRQGGGGKRIAAVVALVSMLCVALAAGWVVAATGLVRVPVLTGLAYHAPKASHEVRATEPIETLAARSLSDLLGTRLRQGGGKLEDRSFSLDIPEGAFTASLRDAIGRTDQKLVDSTRVQAAVVADGLELFMPFADNPQGSALLLTLRFSAVSGTLASTVSAVRVGSLPLPDPITQAALTPAVGQSLAPFAQALGRYATLRAVSYEPGAIRLTGELSVDIIDVK